MSTDHHAQHLNTCISRAADKLIEYMMSPDNKKYGLEKVKTKEEAVALADRLLTFDRPK